ncbi:MAG: glycosyltransferase family 4 protein [Christensenellaceae bacterium]
MKTIWIFVHYAAPPKCTGALRHYNLAKYLIKKGYDVKIFASSAIHNSTINMIDSQAVYEERIEDGVPFVFIRTKNYTGNGKDRILNMFDYVRGLKKAVKTVGAPPDIIMAASPHPFTCTAGLKIARKLNVPCVCEVLDLWPESIVDYMKISAKNPLMRYLYSLEKKIYKKADALVFSIEGGNQYIRDKHWEGAVDLSKVYHINMGIDLAQRDSDLTKYQIENEWLKDPSLFKVVYCGSIRTMNDVKTIVEGALKIKEMGHDDIRFIIYGDGDQKEELEKTARDKGIDNVMFGGRIKKQDIPSLLSYADVNVLNYQDVPIWKYGGSQSKLFDYLASGKPVLTNIHMGYSLLERYDCGYATQNQSVDAFVDGVLHFYNMPKEQREAMGNRARKVAEDYDQPILVEQLLDVFGKVLERSNNV